VERQRAPSAAQGGAARAARALRRAPEPLCARGAERRT